MLSTPDNTLSGSVHLTSTRKKGERKRNKEMIGSPSSHYEQTRREVLIAATNSVIEPRFARAPCKYVRDPGAVRLPCRPPHCRAPPNRSMMVMPPRYLTVHTTRTPAPQSMGNTRWGMINCINIGGSCGLLGTRTVPSLVN